MRDEDKLPGCPRGLIEPLAAAYVGLSVTTFRTAVQAARVEPIWLTRGRKVWLRDDLDRWLDAKAGRTEATLEVNPWHVP